MFHPLCAYTTGYLFLYRKFGFGRLRKVLLGCSSSAVPNLFSLCTPLLKTEKKTPFITVANSCAFANHRLATVELLEHISNHLEERKLGLCFIITAMLKWEHLFLQFQLGQQCFPISCSCDNNEWYKNYMNYAKPQRRRRDMT